MIRIRSGLAGIANLATRVLRSPGGLWLPEFDVFLPRHRNVLAVLKSGGVSRLVPASNIVTTVGDTYYARRGAGVATPSPNFIPSPAGLRLGSGTTAPAKANTNVVTFITGTGKTVAAGYPMAGDSTPENTPGGGANVVTWRYDYTRADFTAASVAEGAIVNDIASPTSALTRFLFASAFAKTADDTLTVFVNHTMLGS